MRIAIIDLGTNSVRFDVHQLRRGKKNQLLHREKLMVRLGQGVFTTGKLDPAAVRRTLHAFVRFRRVADQLRAEKIIAFATSALRDVVEREKFLKLIHAQSGIQIRVISGTDEAKLIALGVLANQEMRKGVNALVDIGGGSTEISLCKKGRIVHSHSFQLGTARLQQVYLKKSPPDSESVKAMRAHLRATFLQEFITHRWESSDQIYGSSGTVRALARLISPDASSLDRTKLKPLVKRMTTMTTTELLGLPSMESNRVDMILSGAILLEECMDALDCKKLHYTEFSLRDGIIEEERRLFQQNKSSLLALHLPEIVEAAKLFGVDPAHSKYLAALAEELFRSLKPVHKLRPEWQAYLSAAAVLRNIGEYISPARHQAHTWYLVKNLHLPALEKWEVDFLAQLCLHHEGQKKIDFQSAPFFKNRAKKDIFLRLLGVLRLVDCLDSSSTARVKIDRIRISRDSIRISYSGRSLSGLEPIRGEANKDFFRETLKKKVIFERS